MRRVITPADLAKYEVAIEVASAGPWTIEHDDLFGHALVCDDAGDSICRVSGHQPDASFIVIAREAMPVLVDVAKLATDLSTALDGVLGTNSDEPGFEEKWELAEATCDRALELLGRKRGARR